MVAQAALMMWAAMAWATPGDPFAGEPGAPSRAFTLVASPARPCAARPGATCWSVGARTGASQPWTLELSAPLKKPSWAGNLIVMMIDTDDPTAVQARQFTALYQVSVKALKVLNAHLVLSPDEGYRAGHTYHALVLQLIEGKEILLAEGDVTLL